MKSIAKKILIAVVRLLTVYTLLSVIAIFNYGYACVNLPYADIPDFVFILAKYYNPLAVLICGLLLATLKPSEWERKLGWSLAIVSPFWFALLLHLMSGEY